LTSFYHNSIKKILLFIIKIQFFRFGTIGFINFLLDLSFFYILFNISNSIVLSNTITILCVSIIGFFLHFKYTFINKFFGISQYFKYISIVLISLSLGTYLIILFYELTSNVYLAKILQIIIIAVLNFLLYRKIVFVNK